MLVDKWKFEGAGYCPPPRAALANDASRRELARASLRAAALRANPVEMEVAARAYRTAVVLESLAWIGSRVGARALAIWVRLRSRGADRTGAKRADP